MHPQIVGYEHFSIFAHFGYLGLYIREIAGLGCVIFYQFINFGLTQFAYQFTGFFIDGFALENKEKKLIEEETNKHLTSQTDSDSIEISPEIKLIGDLKGVSNADKIMLV
jgi:hypothetical protein